MYLGSTDAETALERMFVRATPLRTTVLSGGGSPGGGPGFLADAVVGLLPGVNGPECAEPLHDDTAHLRCRWGHVVNDERPTGGPGVAWGPVRGARPPVAGRRHRERVAGGEG